MYIVIGIKKLKIFVSHCYGGCQTRARTELLNMKVKNFLDGTSYRNALIHAESLMKPCEWIADVPFSKNVHWIPGDALVRKTGLWYASLR